jgi:hypothetical protein
MVGRMFHTMFLSSTRLNNSKHEQLTAERPSRHTLARTDNHHRIGGQGWQDSLQPEATKRMSTPTSGRSRVGDTTLPCGPPTTFRPMVSKQVPPQYSSSQPASPPAFSSPSPTAAAASFSGLVLADIIAECCGGGGLRSDYREP